jgi:hypothetical protein
MGITNKDNINNSRRECNILKIHQLPKCHFVNISDAMLGVYVKIITLFQ